MKKTGFIALIISLMCCLPAQAQFGNLINKGKNVVNKAKEVKDKVDEEIKKANGDVDFYYLDAHKGFYRAKGRKIVFHAPRVIKGETEEEDKTVNCIVDLDPGKKIRV